MRLRPAALALAGVAALALLLALPAQAAVGLENPALLEDRGPIRIDGDAFFTPENGVRGGNGTLEDPYLIAHWRIAHHEVHVRIGNATKAWVVRNLDLAGTCGAPQPCLLEAGIVANNTRGGTIIHNHLRNMDRSGIHIEGSPGIEVVENLIEGGGSTPQGTGIHLRSSHDAEIRGNHLLNVGPDSGSTAAAAVRLLNSNDVLVAANEIRGAKEQGLNLLGTRRVEVVDNTITGARHFGILASGPEALIHYNTVTDGVSLGIAVNSGFAHVARNDLGFNRRALEVSGTRVNVTLRDNNFQSNGDFALRLIANASADARDNYWNAPNGPNVNGTGPGSGETITLFQTARDRLVVQPFLGQRVAQAGAFAQRSTRTVVTGDPGTGPGGPGGGPGPLEDPAPKAVFEGPAQAFVGEEVSFSAARSFDPEGGALRYVWDLGEGASEGGLRVRHVYNATGEYIVRLTVTDPTGLSGTSSVALRVERAPLGVRLLVNDTVPRRQDVVLQAAVTGQPQGQPLYRFTTAGPGTFAGEGSVRNRTTVRFDDPGEVFVGVEVRVGTEVRTAFERVRVLNAAPVARLTVDPEQGDSRTAFRLSAEGSTDPDGDPLSYTWDLGGGATASGPEVTRTFPAGRHALAVTVSDGVASATAQLALDVAPAAGDAEGPNGTPAPGAAWALAGLVLAAFVARLRPRR